MASTETSRFKQLYSVVDDTVSDINGTSVSNVGNVLNNNGNGNDTLNGVEFQFQVNLYSYNTSNSY
jgi:hypothetical protein